MREKKKSMDNKADAVLNDVKERLMGVAAEASLLSSEILNDVQKQALVDACKELRINDVACILNTTPHTTDPLDVAVTAHKVIILHNLRECGHMLRSEAALILLEAWKLTGGESRVGFAVSKSACEIEDGGSIVSAVKRLTSLEKRSKNRAKLLYDTDFLYLNEILALVSQAKAILAPLI